MKLYPIVATLLLSTALAFSQVCPPTPQSQCLVQQPTVVSAAQPCVPIAVLPTTATTMPTSATLGVSPICPVGNVSTETGCLLNEIAALRGEVRATRAQLTAIALQTQGMALANRLDRLMTEEALFRQSISDNPNLPNAQLIASQLSTEAMALNRDVAAFSQQLNMVPADQRPYLAASLSSFDQLYWQPTLQRFAAYSNQFPSVMLVYQPAFANNPWLNSWVCNYQASLSGLAQVPQTYASARWWTTQTAVLGTTEMTCPSGNVVTLPSGSVIYIPPTATVAGTTQTIGVCPPVITGQTCSPQRFY